MFYRWICLLVMLLCVAGCNRKTVVKANSKTAEEWSKVLQTGKTDDRTKALDLISKICAGRSDSGAFLGRRLEARRCQHAADRDSLLEKSRPQGLDGCTDLQALLANEAEEKHIKKEAEEASR